MAQALAHVATIGLLQERSVRSREILAEQLESALNSRTVVEQAKGAVSEYRNVSVDDAFLILRAHARRTHRLLGDVAHSVLIDPASMKEVSDLPSVTTH
jgi:AmiR/NasT family two-component response regulator